MKRIGLILLLNMSVFPLFALGPIAHNYVALQAQKQLKKKNKSAYLLTKQYQDIFLTGSDYPDTGYIMGASYGEKSHWGPFVKSYVDYVKKKYPNPSIQKEKLTAFLLGVTTHIKSDILAHSYYYKLVAKKDFKDINDKKEARKIAHKYMDAASDNYVIVKKHINYHPVSWWVPVNDLLTIYQSMGKKVSKKEIIQSNAIFYFATGLDESMIAQIFYAYLRFYRAPFAMTHFESKNKKNKRYDSFPAEVGKATDYIVSTYRHLDNKEPNEQQDDTMPCYVKAEKFSLIEQFVSKAIRSGWVEITPLEDLDGNIMFTPESIVVSSRFLRELMAFYKTLVTYYHIPKHHI